MEIERRFIVQKWDFSITDGVPYEHIVQSYFQTPPDRSVSIRISDGGRATLRPKFGKGLVRDDSREGPIDLDTARILLETTCPDRLTKHRYRIPVHGGKGVWEIDLYQNELHGLVKVELELESADDAVSQPSWVSRWTEVTETLTDQHLARVATTLRGLATDRPIHELVLNRPILPMVVVTGSPCSGKTTLMNVVIGQMPEIHTVPEIATILIGQLGLIPPVGDRVANRQFQETVYRIQRTIEDESCAHAMRLGKKLVLLDRGTVDSAAYLEGGLQEFLQITRTSLEHEYERYKHVLCMEIPTEQVYDANRHSNAARTEPYAQALRLSQSTHECWMRHPAFRQIYNKDTFDEKVNGALQFIRALLG